MVISRRTNAVKKPQSCCRAARIFFWVAVAGLILVACHIVLVLALRCRGREVPAVLEVPRMELWFALVLLQPIGQACGSARSRLVARFLHNRPS